MGDEPGLVSFAEDARAVIALGPDEERIDLGSAVVTLGPGPHYWSSGVARVRFGHDVARELERVRETIAERGHTSAAWTVGGSATPSDVVARLLDLGLAPEPGNGSLVMVTTEAPTPRATPFRVVVVSSADEYRATLDVASHAFGHDPEDAEAERRSADEDLAAERAGGHIIRLLAFDGEDPVSTGRAWYGPGGLYLGGLATIPSHRRRGAMSTLVTHAWDAAVRHGTPALVAYGNAMSAPALEGLGFGAVGRVRHLVDRFD